MDILILAQKALEDKDYRTAYDLYSSILSEEKNSSPVLQGLATSLYFLGRYTEALSMARNALALQPDLARMHLIVAYILARKGDLDECKKEAKIALDLEPDMPDALAFNGGLLIFENDISNASGMLQKATELNPSDWLAHYNLGLTYVAKKLRKDALYQFKISFQLKPSIKTYLRLSELYVSIYRVWFLTLTAAAAIALFVQKALWIPMIYLGYFILIDIFRITIDHNKRRWITLALGMALLTYAFWVRP